MGDQRTIGDLIRDLYLGVADALGSRKIETAVGHRRPRRRVALAAGLRRGERGRRTRPSRSRPRRRPCSGTPRAHGIEVDPAWRRTRSPRAARRARRARPAPADVPVRLPGDRRAARPPAPRDPGLIEAWDLDHRRGRARHRVLRARGPGRPARGAHRRSRCARPVDPGHAARRGLPARPGVRRAADGGARPRGRPPRHALHRRGVRETILFPHLKPRPGCPACGPSGSHRPDRLVAILFYFLVKSDDRGGPPRAHRRPRSREEDARRRVAEDDARPGPSATPRFEREPREFHVIAVNFTFPLPSADRGSGLRGVYAVPAGHEMAGEDT